MVDDPDLIADKPPNSEAMYFANQSVLPHPQANEFHDE